MHFDFTVIRTEGYSFDPEDFRGLDWSDIVAALRAEVPTGTDPLEVQNAAAALHAWLEGR